MSDKAKLTEWAVAKIAKCSSLGQARQLIMTMRSRGAYFAATEEAYEALRARLDRSENLAREEQPW